MTPSQYDVLKAEAIASFSTLSDYVRKILATKTPVIKHTTEVVFDNPKVLKIFCKLGAYGNNLNQIAAHLNSDGNITDCMWKDIKDCILKIYEIRDSVKEISAQKAGTELYLDLVFRQ